jgi:dihydrodipicolinate synthase/N-acetylneuraminate lyase
MIFKGIIVPLITPLTDRDTLDQDGLARLIEHVISGGVHGIFILGTSGELPHLSSRLRRELITRVCALVKNRVPVLVGISDTAFIETVNLAHHATESGADALVLTTPYYFPAGQTELRSYLDHLMPELTLPVMLYNIPSLTKIWFEIDTLRDLTAHPGIIGLKDSSGDMDYFANALTLKKQRPDWTFFVGPEALLLDALALGADGGVNGGANVFPALFARIYNCTASGKPTSSDMAQLQSWQSAYDIGKYPSRHIKTMKCGLSLLTICDDFMAEPFHRYKAPERAQVAAILNAILTSS